MLIVFYQEVWIKGKSGRGVLLATEIKKMRCWRGKTRFKGTGFELIPAD
jgi:hypothetical protein